MKKCVDYCIKSDTSCPFKNCRYWIDSDENQNCTFIAILKNGPMTLRQIAKIEKVSHVMIRNIEHKALKKLLLRIKDKKDECF